MNNSSTNSKLNTPKQNVNNSPTNAKQSVANKTRKIGNYYENKFMKPTLRPRKVVKRPAWVNLVPNKELDNSWKGTAKGSE